MSHQIYKLYIDTPEIFTANIQIEGTDDANATCRLIVETSNYNLMFPGTINGNEISIPITKLKSLLSEGDTGNLKLEVLADDMLFSALSMPYTASVKRKVVAEVIDNKAAQIKNKVDIKVNVSENVVEVKPFVKDLAGKILKEDISVINLQENIQKVKQIVDKMIKSDIYNISAKDIPNLVKEAMIYNDNN